ncbi:MAG: hypothetical protein IT379_05495 [Deltaproteobacteria bacterium]|nr:hypothetical protein [Deltaproteobacteria bacterium]
MAVQLAAVLTSCASLWSADARGDDWRLDTDVVGQSYEVRTADGAALLVRRRLTVVLGGIWTRPLDRARPLTGPRLRAVVRVRLEQELGSACSLVVEDLCFRETSPDIPTDFVPGWEPNRVDAPLVYVEATRLPLGTSARIGRQLVLDPLGMLALDGVAIGAAPEPWLALELLGGALVSAASPLGTGRWEPLGIRRADRDGWDDALATHVDDLALTAVTGASAGVEGEAGALRFLWRRYTREDGDVPWEAVGAQARLTLERFAVTSRGVLDLGVDRITNAEVRATLRLGDLEESTVELVAFGTHDEPVFDVTSVFAYFTSLPSDAVGLRAGWIRPRWSLHGGGRLRHVHGALSNGDDASELAPSLDADASWRLGERLRLGASAFVGTGMSAPLAGLDLHSTIVLSRAIELEGRASLWHFDDELRSGMSGAVVSGVMGVSWRVGFAKLSFEIEGAASEPAGLRLRGLGVAHVEGWL